MRRNWFANDDVSTDILCRLSAKTLHCLKYVSKEWHHLISDRSFIVLQLKKTEPLSGFFFQEIFQWAEHEDKELVTYIPVHVENVNTWTNVLDFLPEKVLIQSLNNGLLCCRSCFPNPHPRIYVCNPLTKQWMSIEWPNPSKSSSISLVFDPFKNPINVSTNFKLVEVSRIEVEEDEYCFLFDIYSSETGLWRRSNERCLCNFNLTKNKGVMIEGILYWLTEGYQILMFDPENELSWLIEAPLPPTEFSSIPEMCIGDSKGKLYYVIVSEDGLQLWVLEDYFASQWELKITISLEELEKENPKVCYKLSEKIANRLCRDVVVGWMDPLAFKDGMLLLRVSVNVYSYEFDARRMKKLCDVKSLGPKSMFAPVVVPYTMSLVPLDQP